MPELANHLWVRLSSDGCAFNVLPAAQAANADEAHQQLHPDPQERDGFHVRLYSPQQWKRQGVRCFTARCGHWAKEVP